MINVGSISEQTLAGMVTTATHGTGLTHRVLSTHVQALHLLLADGSHVRCSRSDNSELFVATLCGLGSTGLILDIQLQVAPAFKLREVQETFKFDAVVDRLDEVVKSAEYVRLWWWPQAGDIRVSAMDKTNEVRLLSVFLFAAANTMTETAETPCGQLVVALVDRIPRRSISSIPWSIHPTPEHLDRSIHVVAGEQQDRFDR